MRTAVTAIGLCLAIGCGAPDEPEANDLGSLEQPIVIKPSSTGKRTWGSETLSNDRLSCDNLIARNCFFLDNIPDNDFSTSEQVYKVFLEPEFTGDIRTRLVDGINGWASSVASAASGAVSPRSLSQVTAASAANIDIQKVPLTGTQDTKYSRYARVDFSGCALWGNTTTPDNVTVVSTYNKCTNVRIRLDITALDAYTSSQGYTLTQQRQKRIDTLYHALHIAFGIGTQLNTSGKNSSKTFTQTAPATLFTVEELCRLKAVDFRNNAFIPKTVGVRSATCSD